MTDCTNLIERLRELQSVIAKGGTTRLPDSEAVREAAEAIEALQGDRDQLQRDFTYMKQQRDALQAENERLKDLELTWRICHERSSDAAQDLANDRDALQAKLDALQTQEPVGFVAPHELKDLKEGFPITVVLFPSHKRTSPLYAAPKALEPLTQQQIDEMCGEANRGFCIDLDEYTKAVRDTERHHGITKGTPT